MYTCGELFECWASPRSRNYNGHNFLLEQLKDHGPDFHTDIGTITVLLGFFFSSLIFPGSVLICNIVRTQSWPGSNEKEIEKDLAPST